MSARGSMYRFSLHRNAALALLVGIPAAATALFAGGVVLGLGLAEPRESVTLATGRLAAQTFASAGIEVAADSRPAARPVPASDALAGRDDTPVAAARLGLETTPPQPAPPPPPRVLPASFDPSALRAVAGPSTVVSLRYDGRQRVPAVPFGRSIYNIARRHSLNPDVVAALVWAESAFDPQAVSSKGARGLMQVMPATGERFGVEPELLWEPEANVVAGARYLSWLGERFDDDLTLVLAAYNAGEGAVEEHGGVPPFRETRSYVSRILDSLGSDGGATP